LHFQGKQNLAAQAV